MGQALTDAATRQGIAQHVRAAGEIEARGD